MRVTLALLTVLVLFSGCAEVGKLAAAAVDPPRLRFRSVEVRSVDLEAATLGFNFEAENRNAVSLEVARITYGLEVEGKKVTSGEAPGGLNLPAKGKAPLTFTARLRYQDVPGIAALLGKRETVRYRLSGAIGVQTGLGMLEVPVSHEDTVKLPIPAGKLDAALSLDGVEVARVDERDLSTVRKNGSAVVVIPIQLDLDQAGRAAAELVRGGKVQVELRGEADLAGIKLPLDLSGKLPGR